MSPSRVALAAVLLAVALTSWAWAALASAGPMPGATSGRLLTNEQPGQAVIDADGLTPGSRRTGSLALVNDGPGAELTLRTTVRDEPGPRGGVLSDELVLEISEVTGAGRGRRIWSGRLVDGRVVAKLPVPEGARRTLRLTATLPRGASDEVQGARSWFELHWAE